MTKESLGVMWLTTEDSDWGLWLGTLVKIEWEIPKKLRTVFCCSGLRLRTPLMTTEQLKFQLWSRFNEKCPKKIRKTLVCCVVWFFLIMIPTLVWTLDFVPGPSFSKTTPHNKQRSFLFFWHFSLNLDQSWNLSCSVVFSVVLYSKTRSLIFLEFCFF